MSITSQNSAKISHYLGIDFGAAKIGLALADSETRIATAYKTIENDKNFLANLRGIIKKENVEMVVIGRLGKWGGSGKKMGRENGIKGAKGIKNKGIKGIMDVAKKLGVAVEFQDEMFTTKMAEANLKEKGAKKIKRFDNEEAARIILQSWMDRKA